MPALPTETYYYRKNTGQDNATSLAATDWTEDADGTFTGDVGDTYDAVCVGPSRIARKVNDNTVTLNPIADLNLEAGESGTVNTGSTGTNRSFSVSGPTWLTINGSGVLSYNAPSLVSPISTTATITVSNSVSSASRTINVDVAAAPVAPEPGSETQLTDNGNGTMTITPASSPETVLTDNGNGTMTITYS